MRRLACLLALVLPAVASAQNQDCLSAKPSLASKAAALQAPMQFTLHEEQGVRVLRATGRIDPGAEKRLARVVEGGGQFEEIWFHSPGGDVEAGMRLGRMLRAGGYLARILPGEACTGACSEAFLGAVARIVEPGGLFGMVPPRPAADANANADRARHYVRMGVSLDLMRSAAGTSPARPCYLSPAALRRYNVSNTSSTETGRPL